VYCYRPSAATYRKAPARFAPSRYGEQTLTSVARNVTILRPGYFMDNWASGIGIAKKTGLLPSFIPSQMKMPMIFTRDIGRVAADRLIAAGVGHAIVELAGPEEYSPEQVATALGGILGQAVAVQAAPLSAVVPTFTSFGFSAEAAGLFEEMYASFSKSAVGYERPKPRSCEGPFSLAEALRGDGVRKEADYANRDNPTPKTLSESIRLGPIIWSETGFPSAT
jgi:uncharacterized protein YbjT (DUF2867 family)